MHGNFNDRKGQFIILFSLHFLILNITKIISSYFNSNNKRLFYKNQKNIPKQKKLTISVL